MRISTNVTSWLLSISSQESVEMEKRIDASFEFGFLDVDHGVMMSIDNHFHSLFDLDDDDDDDDDREEKNRCFWDTQHRGLEVFDDVRVASLPPPRSFINVYKTSSLETKIRNATKEAIHEIESSTENGTLCVCNNRKMGGTSCKICLLMEVSKRLQKAGFDSAVCKTKWRSSLDILPGEHTFLDVRDNSNPKKGEVRVMIELNLKAEFEMAKGSDEYNKLIKKLPEVFVGKEERLRNLIKILCMAAKKCMKDKKMHMGPWRKQKYMEAKWLGPCERNISITSLPIGYAERIITKPKSRASMLTIDLLEKLPTLHCTLLRFSNW